MNKYGFAIGFAFIGIGIASWLAFEFDWDYITALIVGAGAGAFVGFFFAGLRAAKGTILQQNFQKLGTLSGRSLAEIENKCGKSTAYTTCTISDRNNVPGFLYTWTESNYSITLLFDANRKCIGVNKETVINK